MPENGTFDVLLVVARPAAGKSEVIDYLKRTPLHTRMARFHIGEFQEFDDFPILWGWFEEDAILKQMGYPRLHTDEDQYFLGDHLWDLLVRMLCLRYASKLDEDPDFHDTYTAIFEFSRGKQHGGYARAFANLTPEEIKRLAVMYIDVSWEESLRKNEQRFNPAKPGSILEHSLPQSKMERLYREVDWEEVSAADPDYLSIQGFKVPYVVFENEDDVTTARGPALGERLEDALGCLWELYQAKQG